MMLSGSQHTERYEQMQSEINRRQVEWWLYRSNQQPISPDLKVIIEMLKNQFLVVGPFGTHFVKENRNSHKPNFYSIPLQHSFNDNVSEFEGVAYVASNADASILLSTIFEYLRIRGNEEAFNELNMTAICVQRASNNNGQSMVVSVKCIEKLKPLCFYEHPQNGRLLMAMEDIRVPEQSAITLYGTHRNPVINPQDMLAKASLFYNEYEFGDTDKHGLSEKLYSFFEKAK